MSDTLFDKIISGEIPSYKVWEDDKHLAFLTPFPNTPGLTVLIPKKNPGGYVFDIDDEVYAELMKASKKIAKILEKSLNVKRVALVIEGTGVAYTHVKLYPLFGKLADETHIDTTNISFNEEYLGYLTTNEGPKMNDARLLEIQNLIKNTSL